MSSKINVNDNFDNVVIKPISEVVNDYLDWNQTVVFLVFSLGSSYLIFLVCYVCYKAIKNRRRSNNVNNLVINLI
jgi:hypothetical protein